MIPPSYNVALPSTVVKGVIESKGQTACTDPSNIAFGPISTRTMQHTANCKFESVDGKSVFVIDMGKSHWVTSLELYSHGTELDTILKTTKTITCTFMWPTLSALQPN